jgi:hypothetical protein
MRSRSWAGSALILFGGIVLGTAPDVFGAPSPPPRTTELLAMERTECQGWCPAYSVQVFADGTLIYEGKRFVRTLGTVTKRVSPKVVQAVRSKILQHRLTTMPTTCCDCMVYTDAPWTVLRFDLGDARKGQLRHDQSCDDDRREAREVTKLQDEIDVILNTAKLIGSESDWRTAYQTWSRETKVKNAKARR